MMYNSTVVARLKPGASIDRARAELSSLVPAPLPSRYPAPIRPVRRRLAMPMSPMYEDTVGGQPSL